MIDQLTAERGEKILPKWRRLLEVLKSLVIVPGPGVRVRRTILGCVISFDGGGGSWRHPWKPTLVADGVELVPGRVAGRGVRIGRKYLEGEGKAPVLKLDPAPTLREAESWVVLRVERADQELVPEAQDEFVVEHALEFDPTMVQPLALVRWSGGKPFAVEAIAMHHLNYQLEEESERVLFWAV